MNGEKHQTSLRDQELTLMGKLAAHGQSLCLDGLPGVGKTSLLTEFFQNQNKPGSRVASLYVDLQKTGEIIETIRRFILENTSPSAERVVIAFDHCEFAADLGNDPIITYLHQVKKEHNGRFSFFFAGNNPPNELLELSNGLNITVKPLNFQQHQIFLKNLQQFFAFAITDFQSEEIFQLCGGHLGLTVATLNTAQEQITRFRWENFKEELGNYPNIKKTLNKIWFALPKNRQKILRTFAQTDTTKSAEILHDLEDLEKKGFLRKQNNRFLFFSKLFENFVRREDEDPTATRLRIEEKTGRVFREGTDITSLLTATEFFLLSYLCQNANKVISRHQILTELSQKRGGSGFSDEALDQLVVRLRSKIEKDRNNPQHLLTLRSRGFQFIP